MIEAAVAHYSATGKRTFLDVAIKSADLMVRTFGPDKRRDVPGHEEVELALVKLYRVTGEQKYLDLAKFFLDERGQTHSVEHPQFEPGNRFFMYNDLAYRQDHTPVTEQTHRRRPRRAGHLPLLGDDRHRDDGRGQASAESSNGLFARRHARRRCTSPAASAPTAERKRSAPNTRCRIARMPRRARRSAAFSGTTGCF